MVKEEDICSHIKNILPIVQYALENLLRETLEGIWTNLATIEELVTSPTTIISLDLESILTLDEDINKAFTKVDDRPN